MPDEREELPRIRVRAVTSDEGDVFFREREQRRSLAEQIRAELGMLSCDAIRFILGDAEAEKGGTDPSGLKRAACPPS